jgi:putative toxin-antitoxin system antitoxin component (TIGR02293 family)
MASTTAAAIQDHRGASRKDVARFRQYLHRARRGPHAYVILLGLDTFDAPDLLQAIKKGLPYRAFDRLRNNTTLTSERLLDLINIPRRTLTRRKREGRFLADESDRLVRASRLFGKALELFEGDRIAAAEWLSTKQPALGGAIPLDLAKTEVGSLEVERLLGRLEHGVFS